jgi:hypothetical protein
MEVAGFNDSPNAPGDPPTINRDPINPGNLRLSLVPTPCKTNPLIIKKNSAQLKVIIGNTMTEILRMLTPKDVAEILGVHQKTVHLWLRNGKLKRY